VSGDALQSSPTGARLAFYVRLDEEEVIESPPLESGRLASGNRELGCDLVEQGIEVGADQGVKVRSSCALQ